MKKQTDKFINKLNSIDTNLLPGAIVLMIVNVIITALVQNIFWNYQNKIQLKQDLRQNH